MNTIAEQLKMITEYQDAYLQAELASDEDDSDAPPPPGVYARMMADDQE